MKKIVFSIFVITGVSLAFAFDLTNKSTGTYYYEDNGVKLQAVVIESNLGSLMREKQQIQRKIALLQRQIAEQNKELARVNQAIADIGNLP